MYTSILNMTTEYEYENMKNEFNQFGLITVGLLCVCVCVWGGGGGSVFGWPSLWFCLVLLQLLKFQRDHKHQLLSSIHVSP